MPEISGSLAAKEARDDFATDPVDSKPVGAPAAKDGPKAAQPAAPSQASAYEPPRPTDGPEVDYLPDVPENTPDDHPSRSRPAARPCPAGP